jgi:hypothetical protein
MQGERGLQLFIHQAASGQFLYARGQASILYADNIPKLEIRTWVTLRLRANSIRIKGVKTPILL